MSTHLRRSTRRMFSTYVLQLYLWKLKFLQNRKANEPEPQRRVRLSILTQFYPPDFAATGQLIEELAIQLEQQGMEIKIFTGQPGYAFHKASAPSVERLDKILIRRSRTARVWPSRIRGKAINGLLFCLRSGLHLLKNFKRTDILLLTSAPAFLPILGYLAHLFWGIPYICLMYDLYPDVAVELKVFHPKHWVVQFWNLINKHIWKQASKIIVVSSTMKDRLTAKCPEISGKISAIHNWANADLIVPIEKQNNWFALKHNMVIPI